MIFKNGLRKMRRVIVLALGTAGMYGWWLYNPDVTTSSFEAGLSPLTVLGTDMLFQSCGYGFPWMMALLMMQSLCDQVQLVRLAWGVLLGGLFFDTCTQVWLPHRSLWLTYSSPFLHHLPLWGFCALVAVWGIGSLWLCGWGQWFHGVWYLNAANMPHQDLLSPRMSARDVWSAVSLGNISIRKRAVLWIHRLVQSTCGLWSSSPSRFVTTLHRGDEYMPVVAPEPLKLPQPVSSSRVQQATSAETVSVPVSATALLRPVLRPSVPRPLPSSVLRGLPPLSLLGDDMSSRALEAEDHRLQLMQVLEDFSIKGLLKQVYPGPVVTCYGLELAPGVKSSRVISLTEDIARSLKVSSVRIAPVPGHNLMGIEVPNTHRRSIVLKTLLQSTPYTTFSGQLPLALGTTTQGEPAIIDLARMPHILMAGTTGSGKSVAINAMIVSLLYACSPEDCVFVMIDPKMLELSMYEGIPHLLAPVVTRPEQAVKAVQWIVREMEHRYVTMARVGARHFSSYNEKVRAGTTTSPDQRAFPALVVVIDEMADLMLVAGKDIEQAVQRLAQMGRAAGVHVIMATQRPSVDVVTGVIKANFPSRISFQLPSKIDSRTILGEQGAEQLLGQGDMLYMASGGKAVRLHGAWVSDEEVCRVVSFLTVVPPQYNRELVSLLAEKGQPLSQQRHALYAEALQAIQKSGTASASFLHQKLNIPYAEAVAILDALEKDNAL